MVGGSQGGGQAADAGYVGGAMAAQGARVEQATPGAAPQVRRDPHEYSREVRGQLAKHMTDKTRNASRRRATMGRLCSSPHIIWRLVGSAMACLHKAPLGALLQVRS